MVAFSLWVVKIYWYWIFYLVTFVIGYAFLRRVGKKRIYEQFDNAQLLLTHGIDDIILATVVGILLWGRFGEVVIYNWEYYSTHLSEIIAVWHGGMSFIGGIIGVIIAILIVDRLFKLTKKELFIIFDVLLVIVPIGIILGRFGNFLNQELYGIVAPTRFPSILTHVYPQIDAEVRINTNLISLILEWVLIFILNLRSFIYQYITKKITPGRITITFILLYSVIRFFLEYLRQDSQSEFLWPLTTTQWFMVLFFIFGIGLRKYVLKKKWAWFLA